MPNIEYLDNYVIKHNYRIRYEKDWSLKQLKHT